MIPRLLRALAPALLGLLVATPALAASAAPVRIMPLGDSLTDNFPGYRAPLFQKLAAAGHAVEFVGPKKNDAPADGSVPASALRHAGHGGYVIGPGPSKADAWSGGRGNLFDNIDAWLAAKPDIVLLLIGTNDYFNIVDQPDYQPDRDAPARLGALLDKIHAVSPGSLVLVSSVLPVEWNKNFASGINRALPELVARIARELCDLETDPHVTQNLAEDPALAATIAEHSALLDQAGQRVRAIRALGSTP